MNNYDYPEGSDTSDAPWNQEDPPYKKFDVEVTVTLSKIAKIGTDDYYVYDGDEDTSETDWSRAYENSYFSYKECCNLVKELIEEKIETIENFNDKKDIDKYLKLLKSIDKWKIEDLEFFKE